MAVKKTRKRSVKPVPIEVNPKVGTYLVNFELNGSLTVELDATFDNRRDLDKVVDEARKIAYDVLDAANEKLDMDDYIIVGQDYFVRFIADD